VFFLTAFDQTLSEYATEPMELIYITYKDLISTCNKTYHVSVTKITRLLVF